MVGLVGVEKWGWLQRMVGVDRRDLFGVRLEQDGIKYTQEKFEPNRPNTLAMSVVANRV